MIVRIASFPGCENRLIPGWQAEDRRVSWAPHLIHQECPTYLKQPPLLKFATHKNTILRPLIFSEKEKVKNQVFLPSLLPMLMMMVIVTRDDEDDNNNNNNHGCCRCKCTIGRLCWKVLTSSLCYITQYYTNTPPLLQTSNSSVTLL